MVFVARLDARSPLPIANDPAFHHALYGRALAESWLAAGDDRSVFATRGLDALGLDGAVLCDVSQETLAEFLARATADLLPRYLAPALPLRRKTAALAVHGLDLAPTPSATQLAFSFDAASL
jgi:hypothetical protein